MTIADGVWRQAGDESGAPEIEWRFENGSLRGLRSMGLEIEAGDARFQLLDLGVADGSGALFPPRFRFDPATGRALSRRADAAEPFGAPHLRADGYPDLDFRGAAPDPQSVSSFSLPPGAAHVFAAGRPAVLLALTKQGGLFLRKGTGDGETGAWVPLASLAAPDLPPFAFGIAASRDGFALALGDRLLVYAFGAGRPGLDVETRLVEDGQPLGAPALVEDGAIAFPVRVGGRIALDVFSPRDRSWARVAAEGGEAAGPGFLAQPVEVPGPMPDTVWIGAQGYLHYGSDFGIRRCEWRAFPEGMQAVAGAPPLRDGGNTLHALVETSAHYAYASLTRVPRVTPLGGPHLAAGPVSYFGRSIYETLWDEDPRAFQIEAGAGRILLPLAHSRVPAGRSPEGLLALVEGGDVKSLFDGASDRVLRATLYWHSGVRLVRLRDGLTLRNRSDLLAFRLGDDLVAGSALSGAFHRWACR